MSKIKNAPIMFIGGPYNYQTQVMNGCIKTNKIKSKDYIGHYERNQIDNFHMIWKESMKRWYAIDSDVRITDEKLQQLGCWGVISLTTCWRAINGKNTLIRFIGIDVDSLYSGFELCFAEHIKRIYPKNYSTLFDLKREN